MLDSSPARKNGILFLQGGFFRPLWVLPSPTRVAILPSTQKKITNTSYARYISETICYIAFLIVSAERAHQNL